MTISGSSRVWSPEEIARVCLRSLLTAITTFQLLGQPLELVLLAHEVRRDVVLKDDELVHLWIGAEPNPIPHLVATEGVAVDERRPGRRELDQIVGVEAPRVEAEVQIRAPEELACQLLLDGLGNGEDGRVDKGVVLVLVEVADAQEEGRHPEDAGHRSLVELDGVVNRQVLK